ncbi:MAG: hypothetical protein EBR82_77980 [Caulobacteraceae bacterium]|nr:hypothetical protein [Caulobacteraceae bacterium]
MPFKIDLSGEKEMRQKEMAQNLENEKLRNEVLRRTLYPEQDAVRAAERLYTTENPVERAALMNSLAQTTGTRNIPGTNMSVPSALPEEAEIQILDNAITRAAGLQRLADAEPDPIRKSILQQVATAGAKNIVAKGKELTVADTAFELNATAFMRMADQLEETVKEFGNFESYNPKGSAKIRQIPYEMAIAYAKIVDPSSVAREGEVAAAQKYLVPMSRTPIPDMLGLTPDSPLSIKNETTLAAIQNMKDGIRARIEAYERTSGRKMDIGQDKSGDASPTASARPQSQGGQSNFPGYDPRARRLLPGR